MNTRVARPAALLLAAAGLAATLTGCAGDVPMEAAVNANDPACADVIVRLPKTLDGLEKRTTNAQATGAWGNPASVLLYCGIKPSGPTTDRCVTVEGIDWIIDDSRAPLYRFEAYGRNPGLQVVVDSEKNASGTNVLSGLSASVGKLEQTRKCTSVVEQLDEDRLSGGSGNGDSGVVTPGDGVEVPGTGTDAGTGSDGQGANSGDAAKP